MMYNIIQDHWVMLNEKIAEKIEALSMHACAAVIPDLESMVMKDCEF